MNDMTHSDDYTQAESAPQLDERKLASILDREFQNAETYMSDQRKLMELGERAYEADETLIKVVPGRSRAMVSDVQETVDSMQNSVLRTFVSGDRTVEFEATDEADEQAADDATAAIDYNFMRQQDGYRLLSDGLMDGLLRKIGVFKTVLETEEKVTRETVQVFDEAQLGMLPDDVEIEGMEPQEDGSFLVELKQTHLKTVFRDYVVPPTMLRFSPNARHEDEADYIGDIDVKTRSELIEMGFDPMQVAKLPKYADSEYILSTNNNLNGSPNRSWQDNWNDEASSEALERVLLHEEYAKIDVDGDGIAERVKVYRVGKHILKDAETGELAIETVEEQPFSVFTPYPRAHYMIGYSLCDKVLDIMIQRSFSLRQLNDGLALSNMPRFEVPDAAVGDDTYDDLMNPIPGGVIRTRAGGQLREIGGSFDVSKSLSVMEYMRDELEIRSGVTRLNRGLDADAINKTASGQAQLQAQGEQQEEFVARNFAEAMSRLFMKKYRLMRREGEPFTIKVDGKFRQVDPSQWPEDMHVIVRVGLGSNSKDKRLQARFGLMEPIRELVGEGLAGHEHVFDMFDSIMREAGLGKGDDIMFDPNDEEYQAQKAQEPPQQDPAVLEVQAKMQMQQQEMQHKAQLREFELQRKLDLDAAKASGEFDLAVFKTETEAELAAYKTKMEAKNKVNITNQRMGGSVAS